MAGSQSTRWARQPALRHDRGTCHDDFDAETWAAIVEEQKAVIARAAGVHPSKVRIQIGH